MIVMDEGYRSQTSTLKVLGRMYIDGGIREAAVLASGGAITAIGKNLSSVNADAVVEVKGKRIVLPGMVDMHVHVRGLGLSYKEDWLTASTSALRGGITFIADMPNTVPPTRSLKALNAKLEEARAKALVDYGVYLGFPQDIGEFKSALKNGIGLKIYPEDFYSEGLVDVLRICAERGRIVVVHAEDPAVLEEYAYRGMCEAPKHSDVRPVEAEVFGVMRVLSIKRLLHHLRIHIAHVTSAASLALIMSEHISKPTFDVTPHHILLDRTLEERRGYLAKVNPPLRSCCDRRAVYASVKNLEASAYVSDHAPHSLEEKSSTVYEEVPPGFPGLEVALPLLLTEVFSGRLPPASLDLYSIRPATLLGIKKGAIRVGYDADLVIVDLSKEWVIKGEEFASKGKYTPFEGCQVKGRVENVYIRGVPAMLGGDILVKPGFGRFIS